jgi:chitinase
VVSLTGPADAATLTAPASVTLTATASDCDGLVTRVDFYANGSVVASSSARPCTATWAAAPSIAIPLTEAGGRPALNLREGAAGEDGSPEA